MAWRAHWRKPTCGVDSIGLSTVSGGGYTGSALGRLYSDKKGAADVTDGLKNDRSLLLWWLRRNGRFLLPAGAQDALRSGAGFLRGFVATQFSGDAFHPLCLPVDRAASGDDPKFEPLRTWGRMFISPWWLMAVMPAVFGLVCMLAYWFTWRPPRSRAIRR